MKYKSQVIASGSGSVAGATFSRNRFGPYIRNRAIPVNTQTSFQQEARNSFATIASRWNSTLTQAQRDAWDTYGANVAVIDGLGNSIHLTGLNWYIACNTARRQVQINQPTPLAYIDAAPTTFSLAPLTPPTLTVDDGSPADISLAFTNTDPWATAVGGGLFVEDSRQRSVGINFFTGPFRKVYRVSGAVTPPTSPAAIPSNFDGAIGNKMSVRVRAVMADGRISAPLILTAVIA